MIAVALLAALLVVGSYGVDEGEIVKVRTVDSIGRAHVTELWIVDLPAGAYLRAGSPDARWLERIHRDPEIVVTRGGQDTVQHATPEDDAQVREQVDVAMSEKYGFADRLWARMRDAESTVPIRLVPAGAAQPPRPAH